MSSGFTLGSTSRAKLVGVHPRLVAVVQRALELSTVDFRVIEGVRTPERQQQLYAQGRTKPGNIVTWTLRSNHFVNPRTGYGHAVDLLPAPYDWQDLAKFDAVAQAMRLAAAELATPIRWGADWDQDGKPREQGESDSPHFELAPGTV
jgi:peptidoglycan L-alanyl-D-glutamate endopeptidase CwlK